MVIVPSVVGELVQLSKFMNSFSTYLRAMPAYSFRSLMAFSKADGSFQRSTPRDCKDGRDSQVGRPILLKDLHATSELLRGHQGSS